VAATLALLVPNCRATISGPDRALFEVSWLSPLTDDVPNLRPCAFRHRVVEAWAWRRNGKPVAVCGLETGCDPGVAIGLDGDGRCLPGDIYQVRVEGGWRHVFACLLPAEDCVEALGPMAADLGFLADADTGVTVVQARTGPEHDPGHLTDFLLDARARLLVAELLEQFAGVGSGGRPAPSG
jgi:hypothetical protein